jgi:hypothetical protein
VAIITDYVFSQNRKFHSRSIIPSNRWAAYGDRSENVFLIEEGIISQYFLVESTRSEKFKDIRDANPLVADARLATTFAWVDGYAREEVGINRVIKPACRAG